MLFNIEDLTTGESEGSENENKEKRELPAVFQIVAP